MCLPLGATIPHPRAAVRLWTAQTARHSEALTPLLCVVTAPPEAAKSDDPFRCHQVLETPG